MNVLRLHPPTLGSVAIVATAATLVYILLFAIVLLNSSPEVGILAIVASVVCFLALTSMALLMFRLLRGDIGNRSKMGEQAWRLILMCSGLVCVMSDILILATCILMRVVRSSLPEKILGSSAANMLVAAFILFGVSCLAQGAFGLAVSVYDRETSRISRSGHISEEPHNSSEMADTSRSVIAPSSGKASIDSPQSTNSSRRQSASDAMNSLRSSVSHVVRPISSKTKLISQKPPHRGASLDSGTGEREMIGEDSFDSWDTSAVDPHSWHTVMSSTHPNPTHLRILETIPASPSVSRSPSPGHPLDLPPSLGRPRSLSHSENSPRATSRQIPGDEDHIHPLFRSDSPDPPPTALPGTVVTAAPGAGQVIKDRRSIHRMRSGSLPTSPSPLFHSKSMGDMAGEKREESRTPSPPEREMTPPIPDWVLGAGPRSSLSYYSRRNLGPVGETGEH